MAKVGTKEVNGVRLEVYAQSHGTWEIYLGPEGDSENPGQMIGRGYQLNEAEDKARRELAKRKVRVSVPFLDLDGNHGIATGRHARNGTILARIDTTAMQLNDRERVFKTSIPTERLTEFHKAQEDEKTAKQLQRRIEGEYLLDLPAVVNKAIDEKVQEQAT